MLINTIEFPNFVFSLQRVKYQFVNRVNRIMCVLLFHNFYLIIKRISVRMENKRIIFFYIK